MPRPRRPSHLRRFVDQLIHFFAVMLWVAGGLAFAAGLPELGVAIVIVVVVNAVFAFVQQNRADRAADRLRELLPMRVTVRRDGRRRQVDAADVVAGDVLVLDSGDRIPADAEAPAAPDCWSTRRCSPGRASLRSSSRAVRCSRARSSSRARARR